jgi:cyanophycinase
MSVFLVGGGVEPTHGAGLLAPFVGEAAARAEGDRPRLALLLLERNGSYERFLPDYQDAFGKQVDGLPVRLQTGQLLDADTVEAAAGADGIVVGGGWTPGYHAALTGADGLGGAIRDAVASGTPYAGFSAGAMVAGENALLGGYLVDGREVCEDGCSEGLDEVTVRPGLGLVAFTADVHITAAGTLGRAVDLVTSGLAATSVGVDEDTCLTVPFGGRPQDGSVTGTGSVWFVDASEPGRALVGRVREHP